MSGLRIPASFPKMTREEFFVLYHEALFNLAWKIIKTNCFASKLDQEPQEEFAQEMVVVVYKGFYSYDPSRGVRFSTWAWILLERKLWALLHRHLIVFFICNCGKVERDDDNGETCDYCKSKVHKSFRLRTSHSLDEKIGDGEQTFADNLPDYRIHNFEDAHERARDSWLLPGFSECQLELEFQERQILWLSHVERYTYVEIGEMLEIKPATVKTKAHRAKEKFKACIFTKLRAKGLPNDLDFLDWLFLED